MTRLPDFEGLAVFAKVAELGSYAQAAHELGLSVASISRAISRLEARLGARVFNRTSRKIALTAFGVSLVDGARRLYLDAREVEAAASEQSASPSGSIRLAAPMAFGMKWLAPLLPEFFARYPLVSLDLHLSDSITDLVGEGFDAALRIAVMQDSSLAARLLCPVGRYIVAAPTYVQRYGRPAHPDELNPLHCLGYAYRANTLRWQFRKAQEEVSVQPSGRLRVTNAEALIPHLLSGSAVGELPEFMASEYLADGRLVQLLADWHQDSGGLYFVTPTLRARPAKIDVLGEFLYERLSNPVWRYTRKCGVMPLP